MSIPRITAWMPRLDLPPACESAAVYQAVKDDSGATVQSDYTTIACTTVPKKFKAISNALNPKITKTVGAPTIKVSGFGFLGGSYTASFVPKKSKTVWIPTRTDGAIT
jgi:hypothetical protein